MFDFDSVVRYSETDFNDKLNISGVIDYFQDCSTMQSESLGVGVEALHEKNLVWVLSTWNVEVYRYPKLGEKITIGTFPYDYRGFFGKRNFLIKDEAGTIVAAADTLWTLLDYEKNIPVRADGEIVSGFICEEKLDMEYKKGKIALPQDMTEAFCVRADWTMLDANMHVNNCRYIKLALSCIEPLEYKRARVEYRKMAREGDMLHFYKKEEESRIVTVCRDDAGDTYAVMEFEK